MDTSSIKQACQDSIERNKPFPEVLGVLAQAGVERYHADLVLLRKTHYSATGESFVTAMETAPLGGIPSAGDFEKVRAAIKSIQQRQLGYVEFLRAIARAGITDYFVYLAGKRAVYVDRCGDSHVECFPNP